MTTPNLIEMLRDAASEACSTAESVGHPLAGGSAMRANINACGALADAINAVEAELNGRHQRQHDAEALAGEYLMQRDDARAELAELRRQHDQRGGMLELTRMARDEAQVEVERLRAQVAHLVDDLTEEVAGEEMATYYRLRDGKDVLFSNMVGACARLLAASPAAPAQQAEQNTAASAGGSRPAETGGSQSCAAVPPLTVVDEPTDDQCIELAAALEMHRALHIVAEVAALPMGGKDADAPTPFQAGYQLACEEIAERIRTQKVTIPGGTVLPLCGTLPSVAQPAVQTDPVATRWHDRWRVVPVEPTTGMLIAGNHCQPGDYSAALVWSSMLEAADRSTELSYTRPLPQDMAQPAAQAEPVAQDAARYRWLRKNRDVLLLTGFFGNGCINKTIDMVDAAIDAAMGTASNPPAQGGGLDATRLPHTS